MFFSVITAYYKGSQYLMNLIRMADANHRNLKEKVNGELELIIVNDYPEEKIILPEIDFAVKVRVINHTKNQGIHQARVTGLKESCGDFVVFLDQDDVIDDDCILKEYYIMDSADADVVVANAYLEQEDHSRKILYKKSYDFEKAMMLKPYLISHNQIVSPGHCLIRKSKIPEEWTRYIMSINGSDDLFLWILLFEKKAVFKKCEEILYQHTYTGSNISQEGTKMAKSSLECATYLKKISYIPSKDIKTFIKNRKMIIAMKDSSNIKKCELIVKNLDLILPRIYWKIRAIVSK